MLYFKETSRSLRILVLSTTFYPKINGTTLAVADLVENLVKDNHKVFLVTRRLKGTRSIETWKDVPIVRVGSQRSSFLSRILICFQLVYASQKLIRKERIDVVHANGFLPLVAAIFAGRLLSVPTIGTFHGLHRLWSDNARWRSNTELALTLQPERFAITSADAVIAQSKELKHVLQNLYNVRGDNIAVIPHPVNLTGFSFQPPNRNSKIILFVGTLGRIHGPDLLIESAPEVLSQQPSAMFVLAGKGPMREALLKKAEQLGIKNSVKLLGQINGRQELSNLYASASIVVVPLRYKGYILSKVAVEAMATGRPVLTTMVLDPELQNYGVFETKPNPSSIAEGIIKILDLGVAEYADAGKRARRYVEENCSPATVTSNIENLYYSSCLKRRVK